MAESEEKLKSLSMKVKESEKAGLKLNIKKTNIMTSGPITSWQIDGEKMETVRDYFLGLQNQCGLWLQSHEIKRLAPWKKSYDKPRWHIKKQRHYFANKGLYSVWFFQQSCMDGYWSWTIKKAECRRTDAFEWLYRRRISRVPWTARRQARQF